jgi:hypothetical protein
VEQVRVRQAVALRQVAHVHVVQRGNGRQGIVLLHQVGFGEGGVGRAVRQRDRDRVAGVADPVAVRIGLVGVGDVRAVVASDRQAVAVVAGREARAGEGQRAVYAWTSFPTDATRWVFAG